MQEHMRHQVIRQARDRKTGQRMVTAVVVSLVVVAFAGTPGLAARAKVKAKAKRKPAAAVTKTATSVGTSPTNPNFSFSIDDVQWERKEAPLLAMGWSSYGPPLVEIVMTATPSMGTPSSFRLQPKGEVALSGLNPFVDYRIEAVPVWQGLGNGTKVTRNVPAGTRDPRPKIARPAALSTVALTGARPNPCVALHWKYNPTRGRADALPQIADAVATLGQAMGTPTVYDGLTSEYAVSVGSYDVGKVDTEYPRTAMLIQWEDPAKPVKDLGVDERTVLGIGSPGVQRLKPGLPEEFADGAVLTLRDKLIAASEAEFRSTVLHELGHTVGLDHVNDDTSVMFPFNKGLVNYSANDLASLAAVGQIGAGGCIA
jgi:Matrixin